MECIGKDYDGITEVSLEALRVLYAQGKRLKRVEIKQAEDGWSFTCCFIFDDDTSYEASGFGISYGGEGPRGLHKAIGFWYPNQMPEDFYSTPIQQIRAKQGHKIVWTPEFDFFYTEV